MIAISPTKRLFFALWPEPSTRQQCCQLIDSLACNGKPVAAHNLHVTLVFLGQVDSQQQLAITQAASTLRVAAMALKFEQLSYWKKPAIGCLTTSARVDSAIVRLVEQLVTIVEGCGIVVDKRAFTPHVTLFRKLTTPIQGEFLPIEWHASEFCLVESCTSVNGVLYRVLKRWPSQD